MGKENKSIRYRFLTVNPNKRWTFICLILLISISLLQAETDIQYLSRNIINSLENLEITNTSPLFIDLQFSSLDNMFLFRLQQELISRDFSLVEMSNFAEYIVTIRGEESFNIRKTKGFFQRTELIRGQTFLIQYTRVIDGQVLAVDSSYFEEMQKQDEINQTKWFTPYMVAFVLGSLIYLLLNI